MQDTRKALPDRGIREQAQETLIVQALKQPRNFNDLLRPGLGLAHLSSATSCAWSPYDTNYEKLIALLGDDSWVPPWSPEALDWIQPWIGDEISQHGAKKAHCNMTKKPVA